MKPIDHLPMWARVLLGIALVAFIAWQAMQRWRAAGEVVAADAEEDRALRSVHNALLNHPGWHHLVRSLAARGIQVTSGPEVPGTYRPQFLSLWGYGERLTRIDDPRALTLTAYLRGPKKLVASMTLATGQFDVRDPVFGEWPTQSY